MKCFSVCFASIFVILLLTGIAYSAEIKNMARNPSFEDGTAEWQLLVTAPAAAEWKSEDGGVAGKCVHLTIKAITGTSWHVEIHQGGQVMKNGQEYTFDFWAKASENRAIQPGIEGLGASDWWQDFSINDKWSEFKRTWVQTLNGSATIHLAVAQAKGEIWIDHIRLYEGKYKEEDFEKLKNEKKIAVESKGKLPVTWCKIKSL